MTRLNFWRRWAAWAIAPGLGVFMLAACTGEESNTQPQAPSSRVEATGRVFDGVHKGTQAIAGKGTSGIARTTRTSATGEYALSLTDLSGPYLFSNTLSPGADPGLIVLTTVATRAGVANLTPLTTLLTAQLLGVTPGNAVVSFNDAASVNTDLITDANILAAKAELTSYLKDTYGIEVPGAITRFIETPFTPTAGDPVYDTVQALNASLSAAGVTLESLAERIATGARACFTETLSITLNGSQRKFCPVFKSALPEEADTTILDYVFRNISDDVLTVSARGDSVLSVEYAAAKGDVLTCDGTACMGVELGEPADDLTRPLRFTSAPVQGAAGSALMNGVLTSAIPGITLPPLPCPNNRFFVIFEDRSVVADCVDANDPLGIGGTFGGVIGPGQEAYTFINGSAPLPELPRIEIVLDFTTTEPMVASVYYADNLPGTGEIRNRYACQGSACNGATVGPVVVDMSIGIPIEVIPIVLDDTVLTGFDEAGDSTGTTVTVRASFTGLREPSQVLSYSTLSECGASANAFARTIHCTFRGAKVDAAP